MQVSSKVELSAVLLLCLAAVGCRHEPVQYQSRIRIQRAVAVASDASNTPVTADVTFTWIDCPGEQRQTVRSGKELAACLPKLKAGETVPVSLIWEKEDHGGYDWHVTQIGDCRVPAVDDDDSSFEAVQDCQPSIHHGAVMGFHCDRVPKGELLEKCPWFRRW